MNSNTTNAESSIIMAIMRKKAILEMANLKPIGILLNPDDYDVLKAWALRTYGISGDPDRLMDLPLWQVDPRKTSRREGFPKEPMVMV